MYPKVAQENAYGGNAKVLILITKNGNVEKAEIESSTGSNILDNAALDYCKELLFTPAKRNGEPVYAKMLMHIKFFISNQNMKARNYVESVNYLYGVLNYTLPGERNAIEKEILEKHNEFIHDMRDGLNFNSYVKMVVSKKIVKEWNKEWDSWPLSFLLYHDFIQRFPDYDSLAEVKTLLKHAVKFDIQFIKSTPNVNIAIKDGKERILTKIKSFMSINYPDIILDEKDYDTKAAANFLTVL